MIEVSVHPSREQLSAYNLGHLPRDEAAAIELHIRVCEPCCDTIISMSSDDTFLGLLKQARHLPSYQAGTHGATNAPSSCHDLPAPLAEHPRYEVLGLIGKGGMGDVYKARHRKMERTVALKMINRELVRRAEAVDRFHREVKAAAQLSHPNIVTAHDADQAGEFHFMVMEYVDGVDLSQMVKDRNALPVAEACDYIRQAAIALEYAHERGMVHRDIKPHNLMVTNDGTIKILDFGLASLAPLAPEAASDPGSREAPDDLTADGAVMGTPDFISPEQASDARQADIRSDIYSLGATLYFLLAGRPPFTGGSVTHKVKSHAQAEPEPLASLRDDLPTELSNIVSRMMAKNPDARYQTPAEVAEALQAFCRSAKPRRWKNKFLPLTAMAALFVVAFFAGLIDYIQTNHGTIRIARTVPTGDPKGESRPEAPVEPLVVAQGQTDDTDVPARTREPDKAAPTSDGAAVADAMPTSPQSKSLIKQKTTALLIEAAKRGDVASVEAALEAGVSPNGPANQLTALHWAVARRISDGETIEPSAEIV